MLELFGGFPFIEIFCILYINRSLLHIVRPLKFQYDHLFFLIVEFLVHL